MLILDWDVHHGNGTNDIFHADPQVLFVSIHEWPLYPGTGPASDSGLGRGGGLHGEPAGARRLGRSRCGARWSSTWSVPLATAYAPELVLVSAGFDAHADDPLAGCTVSDDGFAAMAGSARRLAESLGVPLGMVLEGGYDLGALARSRGARARGLRRRPRPRGTGAPGPPVGRRGGGAPGGPLAHAGLRFWRSSGAPARAGAPGLGRLRKR